MRVHDAQQNVRVLNPPVAQQGSERGHRLDDPQIVNRPCSLQHHTGIGVREKRGNERALEPPQRDHRTIAHRHIPIGRFCSERRRIHAADEPHHRTVAEDRVLVLVLREHRKKRVRRRFVPAFPQRQRRVKPRPWMRVFQHREQWFHRRSRTMVSEHTRSLRTHFAVPIREKPDHRRHRTKLPETPHAVNPRQRPLPFRRRVRERHERGFPRELKLRRLPDALVIVPEQFL